MARNRKFKDGKRKRVGMLPTTIRPAYTRKAGKKKGKWYDEDATYKPPKNIYRRGDS